MKEISEFLYRCAPVFLALLIVTQPQFASCGA